MQPLNVERGTDSQQRVVKTRQLCLLCVEEVPVGWTEDAEWAVAWQNQLHCRYIKMLPEIVRAES